MCQCPCQSASYVNNPNQFELVIADTRFPESYADGYATGVAWDANWMPGGPHVYTGTKLPKLAEESAYKAKQWLKGFDDGLRERLKDKRFARWWNTYYNGVRGYHRYKDPDLAEAA